MLMQTKILHLLRSCRIVHVCNRETNTQDFLSPRTWISKCSLAKTTTSRSICSLCRLDAATGTVVRRHETGLRGLDRARRLLSVEQQAEARFVRVKDCEQGQTT